MKQKYLQSFIPTATRRTHNQQLSSQWNKHNTQWLRTTVLGGRGLRRGGDKNGGMFETVSEWMAEYWYSELPEEVNCPFCENTPQSEIHFFLHCPVYRNLRTRYLVNYNKNLSDQEKCFATNMNDKPQESILGMAKFLFFALQQRLKKDEW